MPNIEELTRFYRDVVKSAPLEREDDWVEFDLNGVFLGLHAIPRACAEQLEIKTTTQG